MAIEINHVVVDYLLTQKPDRKLRKKSYHRCRSSLVMFFRSALAWSVKLELCFLSMAT